MSVNSLMMPYGFPNMYDSYTSQVFLNDTTGLNLFTPPFNSFMYPNYGMSMTDSIFNMPLTGCMPFAGCMPYAGAIPFTGTTPTTMPYMGGGYGDMSKYYEQMIDNQVNYQQKTRAAEIKLNAAQSNMRQKALVLNEKILQNEQDQVMSAFNDYVSAVKQFHGGDASEEDLINKAKDAYYEQFKKNIQDDLREHGSNSFMHGFKKILSFGISNSTSAEDNIAKISGQPKGRTEDHWETVGNVSGGAVYGVATATGSMFAPKFLSKLPKTGKFALVTAVVTAASVALSKLFDD